MKTNVERAHKMLDSDRFGFVSGAKDMIRADIEDVLGEYFYLPGHISIKLQPTGERFTLEIRADDCALRSFNVLK